mmetsp:Transcript_27946/g.80168  ORF Transcript_27946/g.80168 Transcript_27946/m.80168 type:complete len:434 (+) Transcript_27946:149-1450(+)
MVQRPLILQGRGLDHLRIQTGLQVLCEDGVPSYRPSTGRNSHLASDAGCGSDTGRCGRLGLHVPTAGGAGLHAHRGELEHRAVTSQGASVGLPQPQHDAIRVIEVLARQGDDALSNLEVAEANAASAVVARFPHLRCDCVVPPPEQLRWLQDAFHPAASALPCQEHQVAEDATMVEEHDDCNSKSHLIDRRLRPVSPIWRRSLDGGNDVEAPPERREKGGRRQTPHLRLHIGDVSPHDCYLTMPLRITNDAENEDGLQRQENDEEQKPELLSVLHRDGDQYRYLHEGVQEVEAQVATHACPGRAGHDPLDAALEAAQTPPHRGPVRHFWLFSGVHVADDVRGRRRIGVCGAARCIGPHRWRWRRRHRRGYRRSGFRRRRRCFLRRTCSGRGCRRLPDHCRRGRKVQSCGCLIIRHPWKRHRAHRCNLLAHEGA